MNMLHRPVRLCRTLLVQLLFFSFTSHVCLADRGADGQSTRLPDGTTIFFPSMEAQALQSTLTDDQRVTRENRCLSTSRWIGALSGSFMGVAQLYWSATGVSGVHGSFGENLVTGIPSIVVGSYIGSKTTRWMTQKIMNGHPKPVHAALKGAAYGALTGAVILTSSFIPLLIIGHYVDTIEFNMSDDLIVLKLIGASALGGMAYGGTFGLVAGSISGPCISLYMHY